MIKNKEKIMDEWVNNKNSGKNKRLKTPSFEQIDQKLYKWFISVRSKNLPISGPILQIEAMKLAEKMNVKDFNALNGWFDKFKKMHAIVWKQANWEKYNKYVEENINRVKSTIENYIRFIKLIKTSATKAIPRGHRKNYIPCWTKECEKLLDEYEQNNSEISANRLINLLDEKRRKRWISSVEELDFTRSSRKSWSLLKKLGTANPVRK
ncbi:Homeobox domain-like,HTH CenpB-type DNA-binding domain [Cinara cedri]|uniref:Homeobox domain-like,HTH CenpB-type DNA-binding domain n=1 Tax=Cinara cedri TaxID=506608 RepID=A0A5E4MRD0_9HEMI|nr:Homeobox domain-like,HTH CenpB-type DNA-binding domain [Cinara cedri]